MTVKWFNYGQWLKGQSVTVIIRVKDSWQSLTVCHKSLQSVYKFTRNLSNTNSLLQLNIRHVHIPGIQYRVFNYCNIVRK